MELNQVKKMAASVMKVGVNKVKIKNEEEAMQAMTKDDIRRLVGTGAIEKKKLRSPSRVRAKKIAAQKKKGRRKGVGKRKGAKGARVKKKEVWMKKVRSLRKMLEELKPKLKPGNSRTLYMMIKGGYFRNKSHLMLYLKEKDLFIEKKGK